MKKLVLLNWGLIFCAFEGVAMQGDQPVMQNRFSAVTHGVDMCNRPDIIDFYWQQVADFKDHYAIIERESIWKGTDQRIHDLNAFIAQVAQVSEGSEWDLNTDKFAREFGMLIDRADDARSKVQKQYAREQQELVDRSQKIDRYWCRVRDLKDRLDVVSFGELDVPGEEKTLLLEKIMSEAEAVGAESQAKLQGEVRFKRELAPVIGKAQKMLAKCQQRNFLERPISLKDTLEQKLSHLKRPYTK